MGKVQRNLEAVMAMLEQRRGVSLGEVMAELDVSESTARRLISQLADEGRAVRCYGGLRPLQEYSYEMLEHTRLAEKRRIGRTAVAQIRPGDAVFLDSGTTTVCLAQALASAIAAGTVGDVKVVTNSLTAAQALAACCPVTLTGGEYRLRRQDMAGFAGEKALESLSFTKCFCGCDGISRTKGLMTTDPDTARMVAMAMARAEKCYCLADSTKFDRTSFLTFCPELERLEAILTDEGLDVSRRKIYENHVRLILAEQEN